MKKFKGNSKRILSVILIATMVFGGITQPTVIVSANEINNEVNNEVTNETEPSKEVESKTESDSEAGTEIKSEMETENDNQEETSSGEVSEIETENDNQEETISEKESEIIMESETEEREINETIEQVQTEEITEEETEFEIEEITTEEITETKTEIIEDEDILGVSAAEDFVISEGVLTAYNGTSEDVVIPEGVITIKSNVFKKNASIKMVTFPESLETIGEGAFAGCSNLHTVNMKEGLKTIKQGAFRDTALGEKKSTGEIVLGKITIPSTVEKIEVNAFENCFYLGEIIFEDSDNVLLTIDSGYFDNTFGNCPELKKVVLPKQLKIIPESAFSNNVKLEEVVFGENIEKIESKAFLGNTSLKSVILPSKVTEIGESAFSKCTGLENVTLNDGLITIGVSAFSESGFGGVSEIGEVKKVSLTIPSTVQNIGAGAFESCKYLEEIIFQDGDNVLLTIDSGNFDNTFGKCPELKKVVLPERLKIIPESAFSGDVKLEEVVFGENIEKIEKEAFAGNSSLKNVVLPSKVTEIGESAFENCIGLKNVTLNEGLITIRAFAFSGSGFGIVAEDGKIEKTSLTIPSTVQSIEIGAFEGCKYLEEIIFAEGETVALNIESGYFDRTFGECPELKKVVLPKRLKTIPEYAFTNNVKLEEVVFGENIEKIEKEAFSGNISLKSVVLPSKVTEIGESAFSNCTGLKNVTLNEGLITIRAFAFSGSSFGGVAEDGKIEKVSLTIPSTVQNIGLGAFEKCKYLEEIIFAEGETVALNIESGYFDRTFGECPELKKVVLPQRLKTIPEYTFTNNVKLEEVVFGENIEKIEKEAFSGNSSLKSVVLPSKVTEIGESAFSNCTGLRKIILNEGLITIRAFAFSGSSFGGVAENGKIEKISLTIPSTVQSIGLGAFEKCKYLEEVIFAEGETVVLTIESGYFDRTFGECPELKKVYLPQRLKQINEYTFSDNPKLKAVLIHESVTTIQNNSIVNCPKLTIYGTKGSEAEVYAKKNKIPFKNKSQFDKGKEDDKTKKPEDNSPKLDKNTVTININEENPLGILHIYPMDGYEIDETSLKLTGNSVFEINKAENTSTRYIISIKSGQNVTKGKYKVVLEVKTNAKEENPYKLPLTINATQTIPTVTVSQQKSLNIYEKDSEGEVYVTSDVEIKNINFISSAGSSTPRLVQKDVNLEEGSFTYKFENVTGQNYKSTVTKGRLVVEFEGYKTSAAYSKDITLKINKKLPVYTAEEISMFIDTELNNASVKVIDSSNKKAVKISNGYNISLGQTLPAGYQSTPQTMDSPLKISVTNGAKSTTLKLLISNSKWIDGLSIPVKCKVTIGKKPVLSFTNSTITLNTIYADKKYKVIETVPYVKGFEGFVFKSVEITGKNAKSNEVYNNGALTIKYENNKIKAELANGGYFSKKTSLSYDIKAVTAQGLTVSGTLKVNIATTAPQLSMKASGSIDLLNRENTSIKYKTTLKNYTGEIDKVQLAGENSDKFEAVYDDGVVVLKAKSGEQLEINKQYVLTVKAILTNGAEIQGNIKFKLKQKTPKLTTNVKKLTMHKSVPGSVYGYQISVKNISSSKIESVKLVDGFGTFAYDYKDSGKGNLYVLKDAQGKVNKSYKLKFEVTLKDSAENAKPVYVTVNVKYVK